MEKQKKLKSFISGSQIFFHYCRMLTQMNKTIGKWVLTVFVISTLIFLFLLTPGEIWRTVCYVVLNKFAFLIHLTSWHVKPFYLTYEGNRYYETIDTVGQTAFITQAKSIFKYLFSSAFLGALSSIGAYIGLTHWLTKKGYLQRGEKFLRGSKKVPLEKLKKIIRKKELASDLQIEGLPLIKNSELQHIAVHGTNGAGKSQLIMKILDQLVDRKNDRVIIMDQGCTYTPNYFDYKRKDVVLNLFDKRCPYPDLWEEATELSDFDDLAASLMPMPNSNSDPVWVTGARTIFSQTAYRMKDDEDRCIEKLIFLLLKAPLPVIEEYLVGTIAAPLVACKTAKMAFSYRATLITYLKAFEQFENVDGKPFSIRKWIHCSKKGWLFISTNELHAESSRPLMSMWLGQAMKHLLGLKPDANRRIWFVCDEIACYNRLKQLVSSLPRARKFGGCFVLGMQSYAQLQHIYGVHVAKEMFDLLNTRFFFRSKSAEVADFVSRELGEQEVKEFRENMSYGADTIRDGVSSGHYKTKRRIVYYPEILKLPDLKCFVQFPQEMPISELKLTYQERDEIALALDERKKTKKKLLWQPPEEWLRVDDSSSNEKNTANQKTKEKEKTCKNKTEKNKPNEKKTNSKKTKKLPKDNNKSADKPKENEMGEPELEIEHQ